MIIRDFYIILDIIGTCSDTNRKISEELEFKRLSDNNHIAGWKNIRILYKSTESNIPI